MLLDWEGCVPHRSPHQQGTTYIDELGILELCDKFNSDSHVREQVPTPDLQRPEKSTPPLSVRCP